MKKGKIIKCKNCKKEVYTYPSETDKLFCSKSCVSKFRHSKHSMKKGVYKKCKKCSKEFYVNIARKDTALFCSKSCAASKENNSFYGRKHSNDSLCKMRKSHENISEETRRKMRLSYIKYHESKYGQLFPNYNKTACKIIDDYGNKNGYNFQHAENGGEYYIQELGYWLDGYDKEKNIVVEFYEKAHDYKKEKDSIREKEITDFLKCKFIILK